MSKSGKFGLLLGMATGAITGLLFAPQKGKELRKNIATERSKGGIGHKAVAKNMSSMADEVSDLVKEVAKSEEAREFWMKTHEAVSDFTGGAVELEEWVKNAHEKADKLKDTVSEYAEEKKKYMKQAKGAAKTGVKKAKSAVKKAKTTVRKASKGAKKTVKKAKGTAKKVEKKVVGTAKKVKKATAKKK
jgi:gas vesicle protein